MLKKIAIGFGLLVLIAVAVIYGNYFIWKAIEDRDAQKDVNEKHAAADIEGDQIFRSRISSLQQLGIMGEKVAESKADTCYITSGGGFVGRWEQFCQLDYLAGYTAPLSREESFAHLETASLHKEDPMFRRGSVNRRGCGYDTGAFNNIIYVPAGSIPEDDLCRIPDPVNGVRPFGARQPGSTLFDYTFDPDAIDQSVDLLWITYTHRYYREVLRCRPGLLCSGLPRSTPIQAD
jgi:hypothetical protein